MTKLYTVSTKIFKSLKEAEDQCNRWNKNGGLREGSMIFEISTAYDLKIKAVKRQIK